MENVKLGVLWNGIQQFGQLGITFLSIIVLARYLTPEDYGLYGILMIFISISERISDSGIAGYMIKKQNVTSIYYDTLFVYNMCISCIMYFILFIIAPWISSIYENDKLILAVRVLGIVLILYAFSITQVTKLQKNLKFRTLAFISIISGLVGFIVALLMAYNGLGIWALICQQLALAFVNALLYITVNREIPSICFDLKVFKEQFSFGMNLFMSSILMSFTSNIGNNVVAKVFNMNIAGLYVQAMRLQNYPVSMITNIVDKTFFPLFSKINNNIPLLKEESIKLSRRIYSILFPVFSAVICFSRPVIYFVLGEKWLDSVMYFQLFMLSSFPLLIKALNRNILKSIGLTFEIFKIEIYSSLIFILILLLAFFIKDIKVVFISILVSQYFSAFFSMVYLKRSIGIDIIYQIVNVLYFIPCAVVPAFIQYVFFDNMLLKMLTFLVSLSALVILYILSGNREYCSLFNTTVH